MLLLPVIWKQFITLLPNNEGKKSVNDAGPQQGHNTAQNPTEILVFFMLQLVCGFLNNNYIPYVWLGRDDGNQIDLNPCFTTNPNFVST